MTMRAVEVGYQNETSEGWAEQLTKFLGLEHGFHY
jgi:hypothetical protein